MRTELTVNGTRHAIEADPRVTLLDALRDHLALTGSKKGCDQGQCGACTVIADGRRINACLSLLALHDGSEIVTVEGLEGAEGLSPLQQAFLDHDGMQCGYCTPGQLCSATAMLEEVRAGRASHVTADLEAPVSLTREEIAERMSGNLCRCACYSGIVAAIAEVAEQ